MRVIIIILLFLQFVETTAQDIFVQNKYHPLPLGAIRPTGWLEQQLKTMRNGSTGHLDEIHNKIAIENGWLGGKGDGWEETPYWLDGAVPLAYLLNDAALKSKVLKYVHWTLDHQRASGYFGPITKAEQEKGVQIEPSACDAGEDWWPKMVMLKVLQQYYTATKDERVIPFMSKYFHYQLQSLQACPIGKWTEWATSRGAENVLMVQWLYTITQDAELLKLASLIESQSFPWSTWLGNRDWVMAAAANQTGKNWMSRHAVNIGMALKSPALNFQRTGDTSYLQALKTGWNDLMLLHGLPMGIFSGDEDLHGNDPTQGVELCAIVEAMYSLEEIIAITGDVAYMDALERMTYNALPTQTTDDYNMKQYFQIANQVQVSRGVFDFSLPFDRGMNNVFGLKSGYTCCTANMHQGWTKFTKHLWYTTTDGVAALEYAPNELTTVIQGQSVTIKETTNYPFEENVQFDFTLKKSVLFPMHVRIPGWCKEATILLNGEKLQSEKGGQIVVLNRQWKNKDKLVIQLPMEVTTSNWAKNSRTIERGPLVYALKLEEKWIKSSEPTEGDYYSVFTDESWNFGLLEKIINNPVQFTNVKINQFPNSFVWNSKHAPVEIVTTARKIPNWKVTDGVAHQPVTDRDGHYKGEVSDELYTITLIPYGCTKVRVVAFPVVH